MDEKNISRREALKLAQLGTLLGAGLCVAESAEAAPQEGGRLQQKFIKFDGLTVNRFTVKLATRDMVGLVQSPEIPSAALAKMMGDGSVRVLFKFFREKDGKTETLHSETLSVKWDKL